MSFIISLMSKPATIELTPLSTGLRSALRSSAFLLAPGPLVEALALSPLLLELLEDGHEGVGDLPGRLRALDPVDKRSILAERAAEPYVHALDDRVPRLRGLAAEAYVPDLGLRARGRAAREVHPHGLLAGIPNPLVHLAGPLEGPDLGLDDAEAAELAPRARHDAALERPGVRGVPLQKGLGQKFVEPVLGNAR